MRSSLHTEYLMKINDCVCVCVCIAVCLHKSEYLVLPSARPFVLSVHYVQTLITRNLNFIRNTNK